MTCAPRMKSYWGYKRSELREAYACAYRATGSMYGVDLEGTEERAIREACEETGVPMGYGRVGKTPTPLDIEEIPYLFERTR